MAESRARPQQGWSALAQAHREARLSQGPILPSFICDPPARPDPSHFAPLSAHRLPPRPHRAQSFASAVRQHPDLLPYSPRLADPARSNRMHSFLEIAVTRLHAQHPWADLVLISEILEATDHDEGRASAILASMSGDDMKRVSTTEVCFPLQDDGRLPWEIDDASHIELTESANGGYLLDCGKSMPAEPEWEEDDLYYLTRKDALKMSRASSKHARGAYKAYWSGDHIKAKVLSKQAKEERGEAEKLHADAAKQILEARNRVSSDNMVNLDLHGLHVNEAVAALHHYLQEMEIRIANPGHVQESFLSQRKPQKSNVLQGSALQGPVFNKELKVITGVGNHSQGGGSLPMAVQNFLIQNRYNFEELRPGVLAVHPKFHLLKENQFNL